jgi:hypothetical protein
MALFECSKTLLLSLSVLKLFQCFQNNCVTLHSDGTVLYGYVQGKLSLQTEMIQCFSGKTRVRFSFIVKNFVWRSVKQRREGRPFRRNLACFDLKKSCKIPYRTISLIEKDWEFLHESLRNKKRTAYCLE